jgi:hypothetical protein
MTPTRSLLTIVPALLLACGCTPKDDNTTESTMATGTTDSSVTGPGPGTGTDPSVTDPGSGSGDPTEAQGCVGGPVDGVLACEEAGDAVVSVSAGGELFSDVMDLACTIKSVDDDGTLQTITLACPEEDVSLSLSTSKPHVAAAVTVDQPVSFTYTALKGGEVVESLFTLRGADDDLILAAISGVLAPDSLPLSIPPLTIDLPSSDCESYLGFEDCWVAQSTALRVTSGDKTADVYGGHDAKLASSPAFTIVTGSVVRAICTAENAMCNYNTFGVRALIVASP